MRHCELIIPFNILCGSLLMYIRAPLFPLVCLLKTNELHHAFLRYTLLLAIFVCILLMISMLALGAGTWTK